MIRESVCGGGTAVAGDAFGRVFLLSPAAEAKSEAKSEVKSKPTSTSWTLAARHSPRPLSRDKGVVAVAAAAPPSSSSSPSSSSVFVAASSADGSLSCFEVGPQALCLVASTPGVSSTTQRPPPSGSLCSHAPGCFFSCTAGGAVQRWEASAVPPALLFRLEEGKKTAVDCCSWSSAGERLAVGSATREVHVYDISSASCVFMAKPERTNGMGREPNTSTAVALSQDAGNEHLVAAGSGKGAIRLYDIRSQRRPVMIAHLPEYFPKALSLRVTTLSLFCSSSGGGSVSNLVAGTAGGTLAMLELRMPSIINVRGRGGRSTGAVRTANILPSPAQCLAGTEDGYVICYALPTGSRSKFKTQHKAYLRAPVTAVTLLPFMPPDPSCKQPEDDQSKLHIDPIDRADDEIDDHNGVSDKIKSQRKHVAIDSGDRNRPRKRVSRQNKR